MIDGSDCPEIERTPGKLAGKPAIKHSRVRPDDLVAATDAAGYDVLLTADQSLTYQQNLANRRIGLVVISTNLSPEIRTALPQIVEAIDLARPDTYLSIPVPRLPRKNRQPPDLPQQRNQP